MKNLGIIVEALACSREVLLVQHHNCGGDADTIYAKPLQIIEIALRSVVNVERGCAVDVLNPCYNFRESDVVGRHWAGDIPACAYCHALAIITEGEARS